MAKALNPANPASSGALAAERGDFITAQAAANGLQANACLVDLNKRDGDDNKPYIITGGSSEAPGDLLIALREVYWLAPGKLVAEANGIDTNNKPGKWINAHSDTAGGWTGWQRESVEPEYISYTGELSDFGGSLPGSIYAVKYPLRRKVDIHIDCGIEMANPTPTDTDFRFINMTLLNSVLGVNGLGWNTATQSRVTVERANNTSVHAGILGRIGLKFPADGGIGRAYLDDLNAIGKWPHSQTDLLAAGNYFHIDVWQADYT